MVTWIPCRSSTRLEYRKKSMVPPEHMLFEIGSITKVFTSVFLLEMEREKLLSPDDMVGKFVPNVKNDYLNKISLKNLATPI